MQLRTRRQLGFTLVEMMVVVIIAGVLATLGAFGVRKYIFASKTTEAIVMIGDIKKMQESYLDETFTYLNVSSSLSAYYPMSSGATPGKTKWAWASPLHADYANWQQLNVTTNLPVQFGYVCVAGNATTTVPQPGDFSTTLPWPDPPGRWWYVVKAVGDMNQNGKKAVYVSSSFSAEIYSENEGE